MEIKCQLDATDEFLLQILLLAQHVSGTIMPIIRGKRILYKWLLPVVFGAWFSSCRYGVQLRVVCPVCGLLRYSSVASSWHFISTILFSCTCIGNYHILGLYTLRKKITERDLELLFETVNKVHSCQRPHHVTRKAGQNSSVCQALVRQYYNSRQCYNSSTSLIASDPAGADILDIFGMKDVRSSLSIHTFGSLSAADHGQFY